LGKSTERLRVILKIGANELKYNHKLFAILAVIKNNKLVKLIKHAYQTNKCATRILQSPTKDFAQDETGIFYFKGLVYIPSKIRQYFVKEQHSLLAHGHQGISRTFERIARDYYFPGMRRHIKRVIGECDLYAKSKSNRHAPYGFL